MRLIPRSQDHPNDWSGVSTFHFIDYGAETRNRLKSLLTNSNSSPALKVFSVHWGPNYSWQPAQEIRDLAHYLIDECGIDIVHGHSSHHVQGAERYKGKLIIYGCGDFVDDYAVKSDHRNDLSGVWQVTVSERDASDDGQAKAGLELRSLEMFPTVIRKFQVWELNADEPDAKWVREKIRDLSAELGTRVILDDERGTVRVDLGSTT